MSASEGQSTDENPSKRIRTDDEHRGPVLGLLTGVSYQSGLDYYKNINEQYMEIVPQKFLMPFNPLLLMVSVDCAQYAALLCDKKWDDVSSYLLEGVRRLDAAGAECLVIKECFAEQAVVGHVVPSLLNLQGGNLLEHCSYVCTSRAGKISQVASIAHSGCHCEGFKSVGLLGTEPTMRENYLKDQLGKHGIETIVPDKDEDLSQIFHFIMTELGCGKFLDSTRQFFVDQVRKLAQRGAQGVIMGCTEIELLLRQSDVPEMPLFASAELHIAAAAKVAAGKLRLEELLPTDTAVSSTVSVG